MMLFINIRIDILFTLFVNKIILFSQYIIAYRFSLVYQFSKDYFHGKLNSFKKDFQQLFKWIFNRILNSFKMDFTPCLVNILQLGNGKQFSPHYPRNNPFPQTPQIPSIRVQIEYNLIHYWKNKDKQNNFVLQTMLLLMQPQPQCAFAIAASFHYHSL